MKGFTFLEILIILGIIGILISFILPIGLNFYKSQQLETNTQAIIQTLRRAQLKAMSVELDSSFGVYFDNANKKYILFKGSSYSPGDPNNEEFDLPTIITLGGLSEVIFSKFEGIPEESPAFCGGACTPCEELNRGQCRQQDGCIWFFFTCVGTCTSCNTYQNQTDCEDQLGCIWYPATQGGNIIITSDSESETININEIGRVNLEL